MIPRRNERMIVVLLAFLSGTAFSFVPYQRRRQPLLFYTLKSSQNDNLVWDHPKNSKLTPLWQEGDEKKDSWKEWHFSFSRNGFTDFLPQFSENINCLFLGGDDDASSCSRLPWEEKPNSKISRLLVGEKDASQTDPEIRNQGENAPDTLLEGRSSRDIVTIQTKSLMIPVDDDTIKPHYDCILDRGLANAFLSELPHDGSLLLELDALMQAASRAICDNGIYIMLTHQLLSTEIKEYLTTNGEILGMDWNFDLDGISSNEKGISVSVARNFFHGELPSVGGLTTTVDHVATRPRIMASTMTKEE